MAINRYGSGSNYLPLRDVMNQLFAESFISPSSFAGAGFPASDMFVTENDVVIEMAIPGASPDDINVSVNRDSVTVSGEVRHELHSPQASAGSRKSGQQSAQTVQQSGQGSTQGQVFLQEIWSGKFQRTFSLPVEVDPGKASADFTNGLLTITVPKSEATKPRKIQVKPGQQTISGESSSSSGNVQRETIPVQEGSGSSK